MKVLIALLAITANSMVIGFAPAVAATGYAVVSMGDSTIMALDLNRYGEATGIANTPTGVTRAFTFTISSGTALLGALGDSGWSEGHGINDSGVVVGVSNNQAYVYANMMMTALPSLGGYSSAAKVNSSGEIVGLARTPDLRAHAVVWKKGVIHALGGLDGFNSYGTAINASGVVAGWGDNGLSGSSRAFRWNAKGGVHDLGTLGGDSAYATAIDRAGDVVGSSTVTPGISQPS